MSNLEVYPFTILSWKTKKIERQWRTIRDQLHKATHFTEYEMVKRKHRLCDVYQLDVGRFDLQIEKIFDDGLYYKPIIRSQMYHGFGHRHYIVEELGPDTFVYGVVSHTYEAAAEFKEVSLGDIDHKRIGQLLGYPDCCTDWFLEVWLKDGCVDPMYETALATDGHEINDDGSVNVYGNPMYNRLIRYFGFQVIPYFTCSYECKESKPFAEQWFKLMTEYAPDECEAMLEALDMPMTWSLNNMIIYVEHPLFRAAANGYWYPEKRVVHWKPT